MKPMTVRELKNWLTQKEMEGLIKNDYEISVWIDGFATSLEDLTYHEPDTDHNEGFIAFHIL